MLSLSNTFKIYYKFLKLINKFFYLNFPKQYGIYLYLINLTLLPLKILLVKLNIDVSFSGKDQDFWVIYKIFKKKKNGYFVDLAASNGILGSNTFLLERKYGWKGISIEPNPISFKKLIKNRNSHNVNKVVTSKDNKIVEFVFNGDIGGIIGENYDNKPSKRSKLINSLRQKNKVKKLYSQSLKTILEKYSAPKIIDYLSLDVEGSEFDILKDFPFKEYKFLSMTIERPTEELNKLLFRNDYLFVKNHKVDSFYVHKDMKDKIDLSIFSEFEQLGSKKW